MGAKIKSKLLLLHAEIAAEDIQTSDFSSPWLLKNYLCGVFAIWGKPTPQLPGKRAKRGERWDTWSIYFFLYKLLFVYRGSQQSTREY